MLNWDLQSTINNLIVLKPNLIFLVGRPGTGKSTLSNKLIQNGFKHVELDSVVRKLHKKYQINTPLKDLFGDIYQGRASSKITNMFIQTVHDVMEKYHNKYPIIIEGALGHNPLIKKIFSKQYQLFVLLFLYPASVKNYNVRLTKRFKEDMIIGENRMGETPEIITEYKNNGIKSNKVKKFIMDQAKLYSKKGMDAIKRFETFESNTIKVLV